jgi:hypothetical protein
MLGRMERHLHPFRGLQLTQRCAAVQSHNQAVDTAKPDARRWQKADGVLATSR